MIDFEPCGAPVWRTRPAFLVGPPFAVCGSRGRQRVPDDLCDMIKRQFYFVGGRRECCQVLSKRCVFFPIIGIRHRASLHSAGPGHNGFARRAEKAKAIGRGSPFCASILRISVYRRSLKQCQRCNRPCPQIVRESAAAQCTDDEHRRESTQYLYMPGTSASRCGSHEVGMDGN